MKIKTSELTGAALDWAVAKCEGVNAEAFLSYYEPTEPSDYDAHLYPEFHYSTTWAHGGPIIEQEGICLRKGHSGWWIACLLDNNDEDHHMQCGKHLLEVAMRCYVASKLGDEVETPEELS